MDEQKSPNIEDIKALIDAARAVQDAAQLGIKVDAGLKRAVEELEVATRKVEDQLEH